MAIVLTCPRCDRKYSVGDAMAGRRVTCKGCGQEFPVPGGPKPGQSPAWDDDDDAIGFAPPPARRGAYADAPARDPAADPVARPPARAKVRSSGSRSKGPTRPWWAVQGPARYLVVIVLVAVAYAVLVASRSYLTDRGNTPQAQQAVGLAREYATLLDETSGAIEQLGDAQSAQTLGPQMTEWKSRMVALMGRMKAADGLTADEEGYLKREVGPTMRKALTRMKTAFKKFERLPAFSGQLALMNADFDRQLAHWDAPVREDASPSDPAAPQPVEVVAPPDPEAVPKSLAGLKSTDFTTTLNALKRLQQTPPDSRANEVVKAALPWLAPDADAGHRIEAVKVLAAWPTAEGIVALRKGIADEHLLVRAESMKGLGLLKDPGAIEAILDRLELDPNIAPAAMIAYGQVAEARVIARMTGGTVQYRGRVYYVLQEAGGKATLRAMKSLPPDGDGYVQICAKMAHDAIVKRVGPLPQ